MNGTGAVIETLEKALALPARRLSCRVAFGILMYLIPTLCYPIASTLKECTLIVEF